MLIVVIKMGNFPGDFNFGYVAKIENLTLSSFSLPIFIDKFSVGFHIETEFKLET